MILITIIASIVITAGSFAWGYWQAGWETFARWQVVFGIVWLASVWRRWRWFSSPAMLLCLFFAVLGVWYGLHPGWMFTGAAFALVAYDMGEFRSELGAIPAREDIPGRARRRVLRVSIMTGLGLLLVSLFLALTGKFSSDWGLFLAAVTLVGLTQALAWLKR